MERPARIPYLSINIARFEPEIKDNRASERQKRGERPREVNRANRPAQDFEKNAAQIYPARRPKTWHLPGAPV